jgi:villin 1
MAPPTKQLLFEREAGSGQLSIYRVENADLNPLDSAELGKFDSAYAYICLYAYSDCKRAARGMEKHLVYFWRGLHCHKGSLLSWERDLLPDLRGGLMESTGGLEPIVQCVQQGHEPEHFLSLFTGVRKLVLFNGCKRMPACTILSLLIARFPFSFSFILFLTAQRVPC